MKLFNSKRTRTIVGLCVWLSLCALGCWYLIRDFQSAQGSTAGQLARFLFVPRETITLEFPSPQILRVGESIFERRGNRFVRIGEIVHVVPASSNRGARAWIQSATAEIYSSAAPVRSTDRITFIPASESMSWVLASMLTPERRSRINQLLQEAYWEHHREIADHFRPIVEQTLEQASLVIWEDLQVVAEEYRDRWQVIGDRYRADLVDRRLVPLLRNVIWPIVVHESSPLVGQIAEQIWNRTSFWRFGWRAMYDMLPLTDRELTRREFERFVQVDAVPVLEAYLGRILQLQQDILQKVVQDPRVQSELAASFRHVVQDQEAQALAIEMLQRVVVNNPRLNKVLVEIWSSPRAKQVIQLANDRMEYTIAAIGEELFGNPHTAITPEFSRVLRFKVLHKDCQWLLLDRGRGNGPPIQSIEVNIGVDSTEDPFHVAAEILD